MFLQFRYIWNMLPFKMRQHSPPVAFDIKFQSPPSPPPKILHPNQNLRLVCRLLMATNPICWSFKEAGTNPACLLPTRLQASLAKLKSAIRGDPFGQKWRVTAPLMFVFLFGLDIVLPGKMSLLLVSLKPLQAHKYRPELPKDRWFYILNYIRPFVFIMKASQI